MSERGWSLARAVLLGLAAALLSPLSPLVLVTVPAGLLLLAFRPEDLRAGVIAVVILVLAFMGAPDGGDSLWYVERGWALLAGGGFVAATLVSGTRSPVVSRGMLGLAGSLLAVVAVTAVRPELPAQLDYLVGHELEAAASAAYQVMVGSLGETAMGADLGWALFDWVEFQVEVYPALLGLATLAALGVGWYVVRRMEGEPAALPPFREFRFNDHLVWLLVGGLVMLLAPWGGLWSRAGENTVLFMGGIYLLRGVAVMLSVAAATLTSVWAGVLWAAAGLLLYPLAAGAALVIGLCDTWLDIRRRLGRSTA